MRKLVHVLLVSMIVVPVAYWILASSAGTTAMEAGSQCGRISWYNAPVGFGREWVARYDGPTDVIWDKWRGMEDSERVAALLACGKERP